MAGIAHVITSDSASGAQVIDGSLKFDSATSTKLEKTPGSAGNRKTWTWSAWVKRSDFAEEGLFGAGTNGNQIFFGGFAHTDDKFYIHNGVQGSSVENWANTTAVYRDTGWYHVVLAMDTTQSTASDRTKLYINGSQQDLNDYSSGGFYPSLNYDTAVNNTVVHNLGYSHTNSSAYHFDGSMTQVYFIDGLALGPEYFGFTDGLTNTWKPKKFSGDFNGYTLTAPTYNSGQGSDVTTSEFDKMVDGDLSTYGQGNGASGTNRFIGFSLAATAYPLINVKIKNTTGGALDFIVQPSVSGSGLVSQGVFASTGNNNGTVNVPANTTLEDTFSFPSGYEGFGRIYLNNSGNAADAWEIYDFGGTKVTTNSFHLPMDGNSSIGQDKSGNGNDWTPVNFGGSVALDNPQVSGARPILNITQGGTVAGVGVFGSRQNVGYAVTYYDDGGGNKYYIDGVKQATLTGLIRGATYTFNTVALGSTHPFRLSATSAHGTEYTNGVAAITGAATTITIPYNAPESLYYYCTAHSGMGSSITGITTNEKLADQYASNCVLAMPLIADKEDVSASIACTSTTKTITSNGSPAASSSSSNFYSGSFLFDGTDDCLTSSSCGSGATEYTMECWFNTDGFSQAQRPINMSQDLGGNRYLYAEVRTDKKLQIREESTGSAVSANAVFAADKWQHVAVSYDGVRLRGFVDGVFVVQTSANGSPVPLGTDMKMRVGADESNTGSNEFDGHIQDVRVYFGACKYTATNIGEQAFVVPATSPDILPDTPSGVSGSSKLTKITDGAVSFDGTNDSLSVADHADFTFGSGDFTMEAFVYNKSSSYRSIVMKYGGSPAASSWFWSMYNGQNQFYYYSGGNEPAVTSGKTHYNKWVHCAVSREGNTIRIFDDGELTGTLDVSSYATMNDSTVPLDIGADYADNYDMDGFISNVRIIKGTALYTKSFTPPTRALTDVTNTKLLCCQSNVFPGGAAVSPNISGLNNGTQWSSYLTTTQGANSRDFYSVASYPASNLFDGDTSTIVYGGWTDDDDDASDLIFSPPGGVAVSSKLEVYVGYYSKIKVNGSDYNTGGQSTNLAWVTVSDGSNFTGTLTELILENTSNANVVRAAAIRIDDSTILIDPVSPKGNAAATTFNPFNTDIHTVRGQETAYPTLNPLDMRASTVLSNGNLTVTGAGAAWYLARSTQFLTTGKYYWEYKWGGSVVDGSNGYQMGLKTPTSTLTAAAEQAGSYAFQYTSIYLTAGSLNTVVISPGSITPGDCVMFAYDADAGLMWFGVNGKWNDGANPATGSNSDWTSLPTTGLAPFAGVYGTAIKIDINFGQKPFKYAPPDGFQPLNADNVRPETVIARPDQYVGITTWKGNDTQRDIRTLNMKPDLVWIKQNTGSANHSLMDTVRGATKNIIPNDTQAEGTETGYLNAFIDNGFSLGTSSIVNDASNDYVSWAWKAGGNKNTFNIDDVGYANASDVNMSVGSLNSSVYDQSQNWSGNATGGENVGRAFDGTGPRQNHYSHSASSLTVNFSPALSGRIIVYGGTGGGGADTYTLSDGSSLSSAVQYDTSPYFEALDFGVKSNITSLTCSNGYTLYAVTVDGKLLVDSGVSINTPSIAATGSSVGTKQGFSIIKYTGTLTGTPGAGSMPTVPHGLQKKPSFVIAKATVKDASHDGGDWFVWHHSTNLDFSLDLNLASAGNAISSQGGGTMVAPTTSVFSTPYLSGINGGTGSTYIAYFWHDVPGLQKFGQFTGNSDADGVFVELGFKPAILLIKNDNSTGDWIIWDNERNKFNPVDRQIWPYTASGTYGQYDQVGSSYPLDFLSNGFKMRTTDADMNDSGRTYIYAAWAEAPTIDLNGGGANAR